MFAETECCHATVVSKGFENGDMIIKLILTNTGDDNTTYDKELPFIGASKLLLF